jgi:hypothetical protein
MEYAEVLEDAATTGCRTLTTSYHTASYAESKKRGQSEASDSRRRSCSPPMFTAIRHPGGRTTLVSFTVSSRVNPFFARAISLTAVPPLSRNTHQTRI